MPIRKHFNGLGLQHEPTVRGLEFHKVNPGTPVNNGIPIVCAAGFNFSTHRFSSS